MRSTKAIKNQREEKSTNLSHQRQPKKRRHHDKENNHAETNTRRGYDQRTIISSKCVVHSSDRISWNKNCQVWQRAIEDEEGHEDHLQGDTMILEFNKDGNEDCK